MLELQSIKTLKAVSLFHSCGCFIIIEEEHFSESVANDAGFITPGSLLCTAVLRSSTRVLQLQCERGKNCNSPQASEAVLGL